MATAVSLAVGMSLAGVSPASAASPTSSVNQVTLSPDTGVGSARTPLSIPAARRSLLAATPGKPAGGISANTARPNATAAAASAPAGSLFTAITPERVLDTRTTTGGVDHAVTAGQTVSLDLSGSLPANATAVVLNVTGVDVTDSTYVTVWPDGEDRPTASNLNLVPGDVRPNAVTVAIGPDRKLDLFNFKGSVDLVADLAGYYAPATGAGFTAVSPQRVLDTRNTGSVDTGGIAVVDLSGTVPATATAVTVNLTGLDATTGTYVTAYPDGAARPVASSLNLSPGAVTPNQVTVALGSDRKIDLYNFKGNVDLVVDLDGYYATGTGNPFWPLAPDRTLDTRAGSPLAADTYGTLALGEYLPSTATAVTFNLTGTDATMSTYVTAWPAGQTRPLASNLNLVAGQTAPNQVTVALANVSVSLYNFQGNTDLIVDLAGYFAPAPAACTTGCLYSWGDNIAGQLGNGSTGIYSATPAQVIGLSNVTAATGTPYNGYALTGGTIKSWGDNNLAELGDGQDYGLATTPASQASYVSAISQVTAAASTGYALRLGQVWTWGYNGDGERGDGSTDSAYDTTVDPVHLPNAEYSNIAQIAAGYNTAYALGKDGTVWAWGANGGSLGNGSYGTGCNTAPVGAGCMATTPVQVTGLTNVVAIAADWDNGFALKSDGTVWAWGWNAEGELGTGAAGGTACYNDVTQPNCVALSPVQIPALTGVTKIVGGTNNAYAIRSDGSVLSWGWNAEGQLGNGVAGGTGCAGNPALANCYSATPGAVSGLTGVEDVAAGAHFAEALNSDGTVSAWGDDSYGQLASAGSSNVPVTVSGLSGVTAIGAGPYAGYAIVANP